MGRREVGEKEVWTQEIQKASALCRRINAACCLNNVHNGAGFHRGNLCVIRDFCSTVGIFIFRPFFPRVRESWMDVCKACWLPGSHQR